MDIVLRTNTSAPKLELTNIRRFSDGSGYVSNILVVSDGFSAARPFYFEETMLAGFLKEIEEMDRSLTGKARIGPMYEDDYIEFEMGVTGQVTVRGELIEYAPEENRLKFGFETDQTCLRPLLHDLRKCLGMAAT
jgi:hypothetical protein